MKHLVIPNGKINSMRLSHIGLGGMRMASDPQEGIRTIHAALDAGVNFLNTGDFYSSGLIDMIMGEAIKSHRREDIFISVKFGIMVSPDGRLYGIDNRPEHIKNYLTYTLKRLGTDYIDLYQLARIDPHIPIEDTVGAISELVQAGYVKNIGLSQTDGTTLRRANSVHPVSLVEMQYSLLNREIEDDVLSMARELGVGIVAYGVLLSGLINNQSRDQKLSFINNRISSATAGKLEESLPLFDSLKEIADTKGITMAQLAVAWVLAQGDDIIALLGSRTREQLHDSIKGSEVELSTEELRKIEEIIPKSKTAGYSGMELNIDKNGLFI